MQSQPPSLLRRLVPVLLLVVGAVGVVIVGTWRLVSRAHQEMGAEYERDQLQQVEEMSRILKEDLEHVAADLRFIGELVQSAPTAADRADVLHALVTSVREYRMVGIYDASGRELLALYDATHPDVTPRAAFRTPVGAAVAAAQGQRPPALVTPAPFDLGGVSYRVFAAALPPASADGAAVVALVVDTQSLFAKLKIATADSHARTILLGAGGRPTTATDPKLASAISNLDPARVPGFARLLAAMRAHYRGVAHLDESEARALGVGDSPVVVAYAPVLLESGGKWAVATVSTTAPLDIHERALVLRLLIAAALVVGLLCAFFAWFVASTRAATALAERLRASEQLAELHAQTQRILDHIPTGVMTLALDGTVQAVNRGLAARVPDDVVGQPLADAFPDAPDATRRLLSALVESARASDEVRSLYGQRVGLFGEEGQYNLHAVPLELRSTEARMLLVVEDLSQVHALESQLVRAEKLATIGELAAGVAHEMGTPLGVVRGRAEYLVKKLGADHPQARSLLDMIEQIDAVTRTIRQLLDFSRVSPAAVRPVAVGDALEAVRELLKFEAERRKVHLELEVPAALPPIAADADQLQQVLVNLVKNALEATAAGRRVVVGAHPIEEPGALTPRLCLEIDDEGSGIAPAHLARVFDPFFTTKKRGQGTGLGLAVTAQIVRNHGGEIQLESTEGRGTRARVLWPVAAPDTRRDAHVG